MKPLITSLLSAVLGLALTLPVQAAPRAATPFTDAELDQLLAPIALYPDSVLSHVLIAATVPEEVEAAADWSHRHPDLRGQAAVDAVEGKRWDPSVKALVAFPEVLERMDEDPEWTEDLGAAFLDQEAAVMDRVQFLRDRAAEAGTLDELEHVRVVREREYIYLEPAVRHVVYIPYYDPWHVYGSWWWPSYPPHYWTWWGGYPARYYYGSTFYWGLGFHLGPTYYYGRFNWPARHVVVSRPHRHYAPSPGYSGRSTMRREGHSFAQAQRAPSRSWGGQTTRSAQPRGGSRSTDSVPAHRARPESRGRRDSAHVQRELSARRETSARREGWTRREPGEASSPRGNERRREARGTDTPRVERGWGQERHEPRTRPSREPVHEGRPTASDRAESRQPPQSRERAPDAPSRESRGEAHQDRGHSRPESGRDSGRGGNSRGHGRSPETRQGRSGGRSER
jgi:hypothetical protein